VVFETSGGAIIKATTATDSSAGYTVENWRYDGVADVETHTTRTGRVIIDYIRNVRKPVEVAGHVCTLERCKRCFYYFAGNIGESSGRHFCGLGADGRMTYGQDAREIVPGAVDFCKWGGVRND